MKPGLHRGLRSALTLLVATLFSPMLAAECLGWIENDRARLEVLVRLSDERLDTVSAIAEVKWQQQLPVFDPARESVMYAAIAARAEAAALQPEGVVDFFRWQVARSRARQEARIAQLNAAPTDTPSVEGDLSALRGEIDRINGALIEALYIAVPLFSDTELLQSLLPVAGADDVPAWLRHLAPVARQPALSTERRVTASGLLLVGLTGDYPPFSSRTPAGCIVGEDVGRVQRLAQALKVQLRLVRTTWAELSADLTAGRFDLAAGGITVTATRRQTGLFTVPHHYGGKNAIGRCSDRARFPDWAHIDRPGVRLITNPGGTNERYVREHARAARITVHTDNLSVFEEIVAKRADVMVTDDVEIDLQTAHHPTLCRLLPDNLTRHEKAFYLPPDEAWQRQLNRWSEEAGLP